MSEPRIRVAICGAGIGAEHLQGYLANPDLYDVACIADPDRLRAEPLIVQAGADYVASYEDAIARTDIDLIDICLPPQMHKQAMLQALASAKHVICEKPLLPSLADIDEVMAQAAASGCCVIPVFQYRFGNGISQLRELMSRGLTGKPLIATLETHWNRSADYYAVPWRGKWATELGGAIVGHAIHAHDLLVHLLGPVAEVQARLATRVNDIEVEDCAAIVFGLRSGALVTSSVTLGSARDQSRLRLCFSDLTAESSLSPYQPGALPWSFVARNVAEQSVIDKTVAELPLHAEGFARQFELAHATLTNGAPPPVDLADARGSLEIITAIYTSARTGTQVCLPLSTACEGYYGWAPA